MATLRNDTVIRNSDGQATSAIITAANIVNHSAFAASLSSTLDARAPVFYDSNDTAYYVNPNSSSNLSILRIFSGFDTASSDVYANMRVMRNNATTDGMYIGYGNAGSTSALTRIFGGGATTGELSKYSDYTLEPGSFRSPIFYDSNNTAYYLDPANTGTSLLVAGNVGIGTTSPTVKLDIASTQGNGVVMRYDTSTAYQAWIRPYWNSGTDTRIDFAINRTANVTPDVIMSVGYGSNVGIGTTAPNDKLDVVGRVYAYRYIAVSSNATSPAYATDTSSGMFNAGSNIIGFSISSAEKVRIDAGGNLGVGITSLVHKIQAAGLISAGDATYNNNSTFIGAILNNDQTNPGLDLRRWNGGGAGTNNHGATYIATNNAGDTLFYNGLIAANTRATSEKMRISVAGNVGIGTTSPSQKLHVVGTAYSDTDFRAPIFYDSNDTGYYTDPAGTSVLNVVRANSYVQKSASQSLSGTVGCTIDVNAAGIHVLTLAASTTISSFTYNNRTNNPSVNTIMLVIKYGGTASITWTNVLWANGVTPSLTSASGYADVYMLTSYQGGAATPSWIGTVVAQGLVSTSL